MAGDSPQPWPAETVAIRIDDFSGCPRYVGRLFENVSIAASPQWLRSRLFLAGQRPISNVVDITNYVMLALGNPLHAFDFSTLHGAQIIVRRAAAGERLTTLDSIERTLVADDLVIADADRAVALAGIMGGEETEIGEATTTRPARGGQLRAVRHLPHLRAPAPPHRGLEPLGEGRRPVPRRPRRRRRDGPHARAHRRGLDGAERRARRPAEAAGDRLPPRARRRADRRRDAAGAPVRDPRPPRLRPAGRAARSSSRPGGRATSPARWT